MKLFTNTLSLLKSRHINSLIGREASLPCLLLMRLVYAFHSGVSADYQKTPTPGCVWGWCFHKVSINVPLQDQSFENWAHCVSVYTETENENSVDRYIRIGEVVVFTVSMNEQHSQFWVVKMLCSKENLSAAGLSPSLVIGLFNSSHSSALGSILCILFLLSLF